MRILPGPKGTVHIEGVSVWGGSKWFIECALSARLFPGPLHLLPHSRHGQEKESFSIGCQNGSTTAEGQNLLANISTSRASLLHLNSNFRAVIFLILSTGPEED